MTTFVDTAAFISEVELRPAIWDQTVSEYTNRDLKKLCWDQIVDLFGGRDVDSHQRKILGIELQKKWKGLRGSYARELRRQKEEKAGNVIDSRRTEYFYFKRLNFLSKVIIYCDEQVANTDAEKDSDEFPFVKLSKKSRGKSHSTGDDETSVETKRNREEKPEDEDKMFLLSLLGQLKKIPHDRRTLTKIRIMTVLNEDSESLIDTSVESNQDDVDPLSCPWTDHHRTQNPNETYSKTHTETSVGASGSEYCSDSNLDTQTMRRPTGTTSNDDCDNFVNIKSESYSID